MAEFLPPILLLVLLLNVIMMIRMSRQASVIPRLEELERLLERTDRSVRDELARGREEAWNMGRQGREEGLQAVQSLGDGLLRRMSELAALQKQQLELFGDHLKHLTDTNDSRMEQLRQTLQNRLQSIQEDTARQLEQIRAMVDEKLHATLEQRLGASFRLVSERLEQVQKGLGEMQSLASGVGDLKRVLTNVKTRGTFGEVQLASLLEQILAPGQFVANAETRPGSNQRVEFAVKLPGRDGVQGGAVLLPLDAKFPQEDYLRLVEAQERADATAAEEAGRQLERAVRQAAADIRDKYLEPPHTTDFGVMFLPTEGLYAEVLRRPGLFETLQRDYKIMAAGPTTLAALLNSLQTGFRTLAIEKRSAEVWDLLGAVRTEFAKFSDILDRTRKKLQEAGNHIDAAATRTRQMERKLRGVQALPDDGTARQLLELEDGIEESP